jgi:hypothetical protein
MSAERSRRAAATFRQRIGEAAFAIICADSVPSAKTSASPSDWTTSTRRAGPGPRLQRQLAKLDSSDRPLKAMVGQSRAKVNRIYLSEGGESE